MPRKLTAEIDAHDAAYRGHDYVDKQIYQRHIAKHAAVRHYKTAYKLQYKKAYTCYKTV